MARSARRSNHTVLLAERIEHLSTKRQEIIRPILEHPREYVLLSVRALAKHLHTDPATIVRIVHGLGFENYKQFQRHLHELSLAFATSLDTMRQGESDGGSGSPVGNSVSYDLKNLQGLKNTLDPQRFKKLAKRIYAARRVVILASDLASMLADYLGYQLNLLGLPIFVASSPGAITHTVQLLTKQDLVIAISFRRGLRATVEGVQHARNRGAYCVGVADTYLSPLGQNCHELFLASIHSVSFGASYTAPIALANAILAAVGEFRRSRTMGIVRVLAEEQRKGSRWCTPG
jgi:RpiR family transcriptional regulator, carbohydrate utilization regulator